MKTHSQNQYSLLIKLTIILLFVQSIPLPPYLSLISPIWPLIFLSYWLINSAKNFQFFVALFIGVLIDVISGDILGQNALALVLSSSFIIKIKRHILLEDFFIQLAHILIASIIYLSVISIVNFFTHFNTPSWWVVFIPITTTLFWVVFDFLFKKIFR